MQIFDDFDPVTFLNINVSDPSKRNEIKKNLQESITSYIITKVIAELPDNQLTDFESTDQLFEAFKSKFPDFDRKIHSYLADFKMEFNSTLAKNG